MITLLKTASQRCTPEWTRQGCIFARSTPNLNLISLRLFIHFCATMTETLMYRTGRNVFQVSPESTYSYIHKCLSLKIHLLWSYWRAVLLQGTKAFSMGISLLCKHNYFWTMTCYPPNLATFWPLPLDLAVKAAKFFLQILWVFEGFCFFGFFEPFLFFANFFRCYNFC